MNQKKGIILISVLWILLILSALSLGLSRRIYFKTKIVRQKIEQEQAINAVHSGLQYVMQILMEDNDNKTDSSRDVFWNSPSKFKDQKVSEEEKFSIIYHDEQERYGVEYLNNKLNLNMLNKAQLDKILDSSEIDKDQMSAVLDWIDADSDPNNNGKGAEKDYYEDLEAPYSPANKKMDDWAQLYLIKGMTNEFADFLKKNFTLWDDGKVNINVATKQTLRWLGMSESLIHKITQYLAGPDELSGTQDDQCFTTLQKIIPVLNEFNRLNGDEVNEIKKALPYLAVSSSFYKCTIIAENEKQNSHYQLQAIIGREDKQCRVYAVKETICTSI